MTDDPWLDYVTEEVDGTPKAVWHHVDRDETAVGAELAEVDDTDEWEMRWYCPACGAVDPPEEECEPAGWTSVHIPCATEAEIEQAAVGEELVATNLHNAEAFETGVYDQPTGADR